MDPTRFPNLDRAPDRNAQPPAPASRLAQGISTALFCGIAALIGSCFFKGGDTAAKPDPHLTRAQAAVVALKASLRDPASFQPASARLLQDGTLCLVYRAKNGFGGMNVEYMAVPPAGSAATPFDAACSGRSGRDIMDRL